MSAGLQLCVGQSKFRSFASSCGRRRKSVYANRFSITQRSWTRCCARTRSRKKATGRCWWWTIWACASSPPAARCTTSWVRASQVSSSSSSANSSPVPDSNWIFISTKSIYKKNSRRGYYEEPRAAAAARVDLPDTAVAWLHQPSDRRLQLEQQQVPRRARLLHRGMQQRSVQHAGQVTLRQVHQDTQGDQHRLLALRAAGVLARLARHLPHVLPEQASE